MDDGNFCPRKLKNIKNNGKYENNKIPYTYSHLTQQNKQDKIIIIIIPLKPR